MVEYITRSFVCPDIHSQADAESVRGALEESPEVVECEVDIASSTVTVRFAEAFNLGMLRDHLRAAGFPAEED